MNIPVIDLHCDLTYYIIEKQNANPMNKEIGCAIPHLIDGNVMAQVLGFFTPSEPIEHGVAQKQAEIFNSFVKDYPDKLEKITNNNLNENSNKVKIIAAIENASGFCHEDENLDDGFKRLEKIIETTGGIFYIGFMHWLDNRFGGAAGSKTGLKNDGKTLLDYLDNKSITIDLSHSSDNLTSDIFDYVYKKGLNIPLIASHSNFRKIWDHPRNLPDELATEIINKGGLIGINFMMDYLGENPGSILKHIEYGLKLGAENNLAIGADYFWDDEKTPEKTYFQDYLTAATYPKLLSEISKNISPEFAEKIAYRNAQSYLTKYLKCE